jgi:hypothetical protein
VVGAIAVAASAAVAAITPVSSVGASNPCALRTMSRAFAAWGDNNAYFVAPGGTFESANHGWTGRSTLRTPGNETWRVNGAGHSWSMQIGLGGQIVSPQFCVASAEDSIRFFVRRPFVLGARLKVHIDVRSGVNVATNDYEVDGFGLGWTVSNRIMLPDIRDASGRQDVTLSFTPIGLPAIWAVDDVMVDPWVSR